MPIKPNRAVLRDRPLMSYYTCMNKKIFSIISVIALVGIIFPLPQAKAQLVVTPILRNITFPVIGKVTYYDDFAVPRSGGRSHEGNDLMGKKLLSLVAVVDGTISFVNYPEKSWGNAIGIRDSEGYQYWYLHMNNDNPGTDDGKGGGFFAYAPDIESGKKVVKGQLIGWMGDSGNAETTSAHLHFEIHDTSNTPFDPYESLKAAPRIVEPVVDYPKASDEILPYANFLGGANIASANLDSDSNFELVTAARFGGGPQVSVFEKDGTQKVSFYAYDSAFHGGIDVAAGDVDGDGVAEIITAPGKGGGPHIKIFKANGTLVSEFMAYDSRFHGGVALAVADLDGDGKAEIITGPGKGGGPNVKVFSGTGTIIKDFMAYDPKFHGGIDVSALAKKTSTPAAIITAPGEGGGPNIKIFDSNAVLQKDFMAYDSAFHGGVRISAGSPFGTAGVVTIPASQGGPHIKVFTTDAVESKSSLGAFEDWWNGGYDVAASDGYVFVASGGGRRTSVRAYNFTHSQSNGGQGWSNSPQCNNNCYFGN